MKYCHHCHHITAGQPLYCDHCGRSYDVKLCPSRHPNLRTAIVCSKCGSRDLSTPQPHMPLWFVPAVFFLSLFPALVLFLMSMLLVWAVIRALLTDQRQLEILFVLGLMVACLWLLYLPVPFWIRRIVSRMWQRRSSD